MRPTITCLCMMVALSCADQEPSTAAAFSVDSLVAGCDHDIYIPCESEVDCAPESRCTSLGSGSPAMCLPPTGLSFDETDVAQDACPSIAADYTQKRFYNMHCVLECEADASDSTVTHGCPSQLPHCIDNPFSAAGPYEAKRFCVP